MADQVPEGRRVAPHTASSLGLHGLGRIGRAIFRLASRHHPDIVRAVNDINDDHENLRYLLRFDSVYGRSNLDLEPCELGWMHGRQPISVNHFGAVDEVGWCAAGADIVVDSSGAEPTRAQYERIIAAGARAVVVTMLTEHADLTLVPGANERRYDPTRHRIVSAGTCDGMALAPVLTHLHRRFGITGGSVTTLHPALSYQNVLDGVPAALPKQYAKSYALGRATGSNVIPKPTSAMRAVEVVAPELSGLMQAMSFRVPTQAVSMAAVWLTLSRSIRPAALQVELSELARAGVVEISDDELVSSDLVGTERGAVIDDRFTMVSPDGGQVRLMLWYDNEWGYAAHVLRVVELIDQHA